MLRVLGPLAADDETTYRVAMTLAAYLQENRSPARAARRLTVHPNTVTYRVNQAESILGRSVDSDAAGGHRRARPVAAAAGAVPAGLISMPGGPRDRPVPCCAMAATPARPARMRPRRHCGRVASGCTSRASAGVVAGGGADPRPRSGADDADHRAGDVLQAPG